MRRLNLALLASLHLCSTSARQHSFSTQDDVLAYPQFEIVYSDTYISEADALALLESNGSPTDAAEFSSETTSDLTSAARESSTAEATDANDQRNDFLDDERPQISETFELMHVPPSKYLCSVPVLAAPPALNQTATELAKAAEARELSRASARGWELVGAMDGSCLYYMSGWWSYSFCYGKEIVQFHAVPNGQKGGPPLKDPSSQEYVLGRTHPAHQDAQHGGGATRRKSDARQQQKEDEVDPDAAEAEAARGLASAPPPPNTELQVKGDQRYLVQRLEGGTVCDLTGRDRTIEVQYHCAPNTPNDRISFIKEVTTCTYLMVVATPRLCQEVAFQPPEQQRAHPVSCRLVVSGDDEAAAWRERKTIEAMELMGVAGKDGSGRKQEEQQQQQLPQQQQQQNKFAGLTIGGVVVGGRNMLTAEDGQPAAKLPPPRHFAAAKGAGGQAGSVVSPLVEILAHARSQAEGGAVEALSDEELEKLDLNPEAIEKLRDELKKLAGDKGWKLEVVEVPDGHQEIRGVIDGDDDEEEEEADAEAGAVEGGGRHPGARAKAKGQGKGPSKETGKAKTGGRGNTDGQDGTDGQQGSEEKFFKEEL